MITIVYFSSVSENTHRFVQKLDFESYRIPVNGEKDGFLKVEKPYILIVPSYGGGGLKNAIPKQVIQFLNDEDNRKLLKGVISSGNTNFGEYYGIAGKLISEKCKVPFLYRFELLGTQTDVNNVNSGVNEFWKRINI